MFESVIWFVLAPAGVWTMAIREGVDGRPFESMAHRAIRNVAPPGRDPPVVLCEMVPITGPPAPVGLNSFTERLPVIASDASALPSARVVHVRAPPNVHSPGNSASLAGAWIWYGAHIGPRGMA